MTRIPTQYLIEGELDNTHLGKVTGWMKFAGLKEKVTFDLQGDFHRDIRGAKIHFTGDAYEDQAEIDGEKYLNGFALHQTGKVVDITAGLLPRDYVDYSHIEWYSAQNGRVVIELEPVQIEVIGRPIPAIESETISRDEQNCSKSIGGEAVVQPDKRVSNNKIRGMKLLTKKVRKKLPPLYSQDGKGGKAIAYVKFFTPDSNWTWWATEGSPINDEQGNEVDFHFFGLVQGQFKEMGYFSLKELEEAKGPMGLPIERDLYWQPKMLEEIAPELFMLTDTL